MLLSLDFNANVRSGFHTNYHLCLKRNYLPWFSLSQFCSCSVTKLISDCFSFTSSESSEMRKGKNTDQFNAMKKKFQVHLEYLNGFPLSLVTKYLQGLSLLVTKVTQSWQHVDIPFKANRFFSISQIMSH